MDETEVVHALGESRKKAAHPGAALAMLPEFIGTFHDEPGLAKKTKVLAFAFQCLSMQLFERWFVIQTIEVTDTAAAKNLHDAFGLRRKMRSNRAWRRAGATSLFVQQPCQRDSAQSAHCARKKIPARLHERRRWRWKVFIEHK